MEATYTPKTVKEAQDKLKKTTAELIHTIERTSLKDEMFKHTYNKRRELQLLGRIAFLQKYIRKNTRPKLGSK